MSALYFWHTFGSDTCRGAHQPGTAKDDNSNIQTNNKKAIIMNIKPLADRVLVLPAPAEEKIGGIIIPDTAKEKPLHGIVKAAGHGTKDEEMIL